ncbi:hypothetical protein PMAYCL1PPCAC_19195, partial [Pristionchus mayeri]
TNELLRSYSVLLVNCVLTDIVCALCSMLINARLQRIGKKRQVGENLCMGQISTDYFCNVLIVISLACFVQSFYLLAVSFGYRLYVLKRNTTSTNTLLKVVIVLTLNLFLYALSPV